ncbi:MAG: DNA polymerase III subunit beta [Candidatus Cyclobacteriaceae bacterium M3_2C_046]
MKFIVSSSALLKELLKINGVITTNPVVPILENFLFEISGKQLTITASDLQTSMITSLEVGAREDGQVAVPARILLDTLRNLPEQPVTFTVDQETFGIELSSDNGRYKLAGENAADFPKVPTVSEANSVDLSTEVLSSALYNTIFATSNDELRPAMTGVMVQFGEASTTFVATDGHRLSRYRRVDVVSEVENHIIIPRKALNLLKNTLPSENSNVVLEYNSSNAFFSFDSIRMICRLIDERFPDYENVIPLDNTNEVIIDRLELLSSLKRIAIYANKTTNQVRIKITGSELQISAEDIDFSNEANERLSCQHDGEDIEIGFNARFLIDILNTIDSKTVRMTLSQPNRAGLLYPTEKDSKEDILLLAMPVMLAD